MCKSEFLSTIKDVIIIGGGPIGIACALECKKEKLDYVVLEKGALVNSLYHYPLNMTFFSTSDKLEIGGIPFICNKPKPQRDEALEYYRRIASSFKLNIHLYEKVEKVENTENNGFLVTSAKETYLCKKLVIATGFYDLPNLLHVPGESLSKVYHYFKEAHPFVMQKVIVVGASNSSVDAALEIWQKGGDVTMVVRGPSIGERVKYWVKPNIENRIEEGSIKAYFDSEIKEIREHEVLIQTPEGEQTLENDFVVALTGYQPNLEFLRKLGISLSDDEKCLPQYHPETMETNVEGIYLAGVICGGMETHKWFIENSRIHSKLIAADIAKKLQ